MSQTIKVAPPNSMIFISDFDDDEPIDFTHIKTVMWNSTCIVVFCLNSSEGFTEVTLGKASEVDPGWEPAFDGDLATPKQSTMVSTSEREVLIQMPVRSTQTRIKVWINHDRGPDKIIVGVHEA
jgi:hypothetical protein